MKIDKMKEAAGKIISNGFISAVEYADKREMINRITTGSVDLDNILGGGIQTMSITEVFEEEAGGCKGKVAYIDTEGTFRPERLKEIAVRFGLEPEEALENLKIYGGEWTDFSGRGELGERQQKLNLLLSKLLKLADEFNLAVFITNQMMADPGANMTFVADPKKPIGGHVLAHASTTRLYLRKGRNETRVAKIYDSPDVAESEAIYAITQGGIDNVTE
ncbi:hypothetical protein NQ315_004989 [Exocentrus adspersus]|uniref:RecA family profile 2 domain-containing protein n=1 Tax=Exocentrus adspersus TaxID=1586481 RepID=A0AAV8V7Q8_9CUCU|nr:hypothetical protein NQ315_004989 [Exocentrus adspersus]